MRRCPNIPSYKTVVALEVAVCHPTKLERATGCMQPTTCLADLVPTEEYWHLFMRSCAISFSRNRSRKLLGLNSTHKSGSGRAGQFRRLKTRHFPPPDQSRIRPPQSQRSCVIIKSGPLSPHESAAPISSAPIPQHPSDKFRAPSDRVGGLYFHAKSWRITVVKRAA
jgi:hypothetical protein